MKVASKILGLLVATLLVAALLMTNLTTAGLTETEHTPGSAPAKQEAICHGHANPAEAPAPSSIPRSPQPAPVSYGCCLTGHAAAVVQASGFPQPSTASAGVDRHAESMQIAWIAADVKLSLVLSADPPGTAPLRI